jgi:hypothetical protein
MRLSRRDALRAGGGLLATAGAAGCVERRVTRRETRVRDSLTWALTPQIGTALGPAEFESYVADRADDYEDSGVWGLAGEPADGFEVAYVQRLGIPEDGTGEASLDPEGVDIDAPLLVADAAVASYRVGDGRYRYWLWLAADGTADRLTRDVDVSVLSTRVSLREGSLADAAQVSGTGEEATASLDSPPQARFPLADGTDDLESTVESGEGGSYAVEWRGGVQGVQSVNGVCEEQRGGAHDFRWQITAGFERTEQV